MHMSELGLKPDSLHIKAVPSAEARAGDPDRWQTLVSEMGAEIATPLTAALERVNSLTSTGRIDKSSLRALRDEIEAARQIGMIGQQLARFASGRLRQTHERLPLADVLNGTLAHRARETQARGISVKPSLKPAAVIVDASLLFSLINTTIDWALASARSQIEFSVDTRGWPANAQLSCRFAHRLLDDLADGSDAVAPRGLDSLLWRMVEQTAWTMGLLVDRKDESHVTTLTLEFPRTAPEVEPDAAVEVNDGFAPSANSQPLAGSHVLIIASRREMRAQIRDALRNMSLIIDYVNSVDEATAFCRDGLPHAVIVEAIQTGMKFDHFRDEILTEVPDFVFIEIIEEGTEFEMSGFGGTQMARVGREVLATSLPSALMFELSKTL
jgi:hypothetical protein